MEKTVLEAYKLSGKHELGSTEFNHVEAAQHGQEPSSSPSPVGRAGVGTNPFIPPPSTRGSLAYITGKVISPKPTGILPIAKSEILPTSFLQAAYSEFGFKFDTVQMWGSSGWYFPGYASEAYPSCGEYTYMGCLSPAHPGQAAMRRIHHNCGRAGCPVCYSTWVAETTKKIAHRLEEAEKVLIKWGWRHHRPIHVTVNPAPEHWEQYKDIANFNKLRRNAQAIAKRAGFKGGSMVYHPYRERCALCGGKIRFKEKTCMVCGSEDIAWYWSPHFHLFGFGWITGTKHLAAATGYVVKNHGVRSSIDATAYYQLTHCGIREGKQAVVWFGIAHYSKLHLPPYEAENVGAVDCPLCGARLRLVRYEGSTPPPIGEDIDIVDSTGWTYRHGVR